MSVFVSIITITYNNLTGLKKTLGSILGSDYCEPIEWVVVDGGSTDGTTEYIESQAGALKEKGWKLIYKNQKDKGRYDGMNQGIRRMHGKWCIFLNAGDAFCFSDSLYFIVQKAKSADDSVGIIYGDAILEVDDHFKYAKAQSAECLEFTGANPICHQSCLIRASVIKQNIYNISYRYAADFDFLISAYMKGVKFKYINEPIALYDKNGISSKNVFEVNEEFGAIRQKYGLDNHSRCDFFGMKKVIKKIAPRVLISLVLENKKRNALKGWEKSKEKALIKYKNENCKLRMWK